MKYAGIVRLCQPEVNNLINPAYAAMCIAQKYDSIKKQAVLVISCD